MINELKISELLSLTEPDCTIHVATWQLEVLQNAAQQFGGFGTGWRSTFRAVNEFGNSFLERVEEPKHEEMSFDGADKALEWLRERGQDGEIPYALDRKSSCAELAEGKVVSIMFCWHPPFSMMFYRISIPMRNTMPMAREYLEGGWSHQIFNSYLNI